VPAKIAWQGVEVRCGDSIGLVRACCGGHGDGGHRHVGVHGRNQSKDG
jgi:hypothetical protein